MAEKFPFEGLEFYRMQKELETAMLPIRARGQHLSEAQKMIAAAASVAAGIAAMGQSMAATAAAFESGVAAMEHQARAMAVALNEVDQFGDVVLPGAFFNSLNSDDGSAPGDLVWEHTDGFFSHVDYNVAIIGAFPLSEAERAQIETSEMVWDFANRHELNDAGVVGWFMYWLDRIFSWAVFMLPVWFWQDRKWQRVRAGVVTRVNPMIRRAFGIRSPSGEAFEYMQAFSREFFEGFADGIIRTEMNEKEAEEMRQKWRAEYNATGADCLIEVRNVTEDDEGEE